MVKVFVSSTSKDLVGHRTVVGEAILELGMHPVMMEHFPAMDADAVKASKQKVLESDLFVGIYAHRYGYIPENCQKSITELEYDWAVEAKIPRLIFVIKTDDSAVEWPDDFFDTFEAYEKLTSFKQRVGKERVWRVFDTPDSLAAAVSQSLSQDVKRITYREKKMWISISIIIILLGGMLFEQVLMNTDEEKIGNSMADRASANQATEYVNQTATATRWTPTPTPTATWTPTLTSTFTDTPTITFTPSRTPTHTSTFYPTPLMNLVPSGQYINKLGTPFFISADFYIDSLQVNPEAPHAHYRDFIMATPEKDRFLSWYEGNDYCQSVSRNGRLPSIEQWWAALQYKSLFDTIGENLMEWTNDSEIRQDGTSVYIIVQENEEPYSYIPEGGAQTFGVGFRCVVVPSGN